MKVIIAGSRTITNETLLQGAIEASGFKITEVISGCEKGVDKLGEQWAEKNNIHVARFPLNWIHKGRNAGRIRNCYMAEYADALIAIWDRSSPGTRNLINYIKRMKKPYYLLTVYN